MAAGIAVVKQFYRANIVWICVLLGLLALWVVFGAVVPWILTSGGDQTREQAGQFGDMFGSVNALFSMLAFFGVLYALWHQQSEATEQGKREETQAAIARNTVLVQAYMSLAQFHCDLMKECRGGSIRNIHRQKCIGFGNQVLEIIALSGGKVPPGSEVLDITNDTDDGREQLMKAIERLCNVAGATERQSLVDAVQPEIKAVGDWCRQYNACHEEDVMNNMYSHLNDAASVSAQYRRTPDHTTMTEAEWNGIIHTLNSSVEGVRRCGSSICGVELRRYLPPDTSMPRSP